MFNQYGDEQPVEQERPARKGLVELFRTKSAAELLFIGVPPLGAAIFLMNMVAPWTVTCRSEGTITPCTVTRHVVFGLVPAGTTELADVRSARVDRSSARRRSPGQYWYSVTLETAAGEHSLDSTGNGEAASAAAREINEAIRARTARFETSLGFVLFDTLPRLALLPLSLFSASVTAFGLFRLVRRPA